MATITITYKSATLEVTTDIELPEEEEPTFEDFCCYAYPNIHDPESDTWVDGGPEDCIEKCLYRYIELLLQNAQSRKVAREEEERRSLAQPPANATWTGAERLAEKARRIVADRRAAEEAENEAARKRSEELAAAEAEAGRREHEARIATSLARQAEAERAAKPATPA